MIRPLTFALLCGFLFSQSYAFAQAPGAEDTPQPPKCFFQILNGISSGPTDIYLDNKLVFPGSITGQRISSLGWPKEEFTLRLVDKKSDREKIQKIKVPESSYSTIILAGDFELLPTQEATKPGEPPEVRVLTSVLPNDLQGSESKIRVRFVNGLADKPVTVKSKEGKSWTIEPMSLTTASGLPEELFMQAFLDTKATSLLLAQHAPAKNISIVFYPAKNGLGFRAVTETTAESKQADQKAPASDSQ